MEIKANSGAQAIPPAAAVSKTPKQPAPAPSGTAKAPSPLPEDANQAHHLKAGSSEASVSLGLEADTSAKAQKHYQDLQTYIHPPTDKLLKLPQKDRALEIIKQSKQDGSLNDLVNTLDQKGELKQLYRNLGTLANTAAGASALLGIFTLGTSFVVEAKDNRAYALKDLLQEAGISQEILKKL